jgi:hypothetical protein
MTATNPNDDRQCIYCGGVATRLRKSEHILPKALGGALTIREVSNRVVCHDCNNGVLSRLDQELCSRSFLSVIASQEIDAHLWQVWDVDHTSQNLLVEARPLWEGNELRRLACHPQMTIEPDGPELRGDIEEFTRFGRDHCETVLNTAIRKAFERYSHGIKKALHLELVKNDLQSRGYRFAPRVFARKSISEIADNIQSQSFILRYESPRDCRLALRWLSRLNGTRRTRRWTQKPSSAVPAISHYFDIGTTMRALMKNAVNLLAAYCPNTAVNHDSFAGAMRVIRGIATTEPILIAANGFVHAADLTNISAENKSHAFRLIHVDGEWRIYSSFFGGRIGAFVQFSGPNHENWNTMDVVAPLNSKAWSVKTSSIIQPIKVHIDWSDITKIAPSLKLQYAASSVMIENGKTGA